MIVECNSIHKSLSTCWFVLDGFDTDFFVNHLGTIFDNRCSSDFFLPLFSIESIKPLLMRNLMFHPSLVIIWKCGGLWSFTYMETRYLFHGRSLSP